MKYTDYINEFMSMLNDRVSEEITYNIYFDEKSKLNLFCLYFRGFIVEKIAMDEYFLTKITLWDSIWYNYIEPIRRRISIIRQPFEWRTSKSIRDVRRQYNGNLH